jgi:hypothetical protein
LKSKCYEKFLNQKEFNVFFYFLIFKNEDIFNFYIPNICKSLKNIVINSENEEFKKEVFQNLEINDENEIYQKLFDSLSKVYSDK